MKKKILIIMMLILSMVLAACGGGESATEEVKKVRMGEPDWDSVRIHNAVAKYIMETGYGYEVEIVPGSSNNVFVAINTGDVDVLMEAWSDNYPNYKKSIEEKTMDELGINFDDNNQGFYVPRYLIEGDKERGIEPLAKDLKTVEDLMKYSELFPDPSDDTKGVVVNAPPTYVASQIMETKFNNYNLSEKYNLSNPGSPAALFASLSSAYESGTPWVGYMWEPTWLSGKYDLVLLEEEAFSQELWDDEYKCAFKSVPVTIIGSRNFVDNNTELVEFLSKYETSSQITAEILSYMQTNDVGIEEAATWFMKEKQDVWTTWVSEEAKEKVLNSIK